jgi:probable HAF family extracellular repeat protein
MNLRALMSSSLLVLALAGPCFADPVYSVTPVNFDTTGVLLNNVGQYVVPAYGGAYLVNGYGPNAGQAVPITIPGATAINPTGLNDSGQVVGAYAGSSGAPVPFLYSGGQTTNLSTSAGFDAASGALTQNPYFGNSSGVAINNAGAVAGQIATPSNNADNHLGLYSQGSVTNLGSVWTADSLYPAGQHSAYVMGINSSGQIAFIDNEGISPAVFKNGSFVTLPIPSNALGISPIGINDSGQLAGTLSTFSGQRTAVLFTNGAWQNLGTLGGTVSSALGINNSGAVVGWSTTSGGAIHAFLYQNGTMTDLNSLLPSSLSGVTLIGASSINNQGQIVAFGDTSPSGPMQDYLLTPPGEAPLAGVTNLPEPSTLAFFGLLAGGFFIRRALKRVR